MKVLLDTHPFLWWVTDDPKLSFRAREIISNINNELFFSAASGWEITKITPENPVLSLRLETEWTGMKGVSAEGRKKLNQMLKRY
jgi:PIN domain nuclease of toxin-antitoxin system